MLGLVSQQQQSGGQQSTYAYVAAGMSICCGQPTAGRLRRSYSATKMLSGYKREELF